MAPDRGEPAARGTAGMAVRGAPALPPVVPAVVDDPFPIARVRVTEAKLPDAVKQFDLGPLVRMPRDEFEARARKAGLATAAARAVPRILSAEYTASLSGGDISGSAEFAILNPKARPAALPLEPLRLAIQSAAWADGREAVIGNLGPGFPPGPAVWVDGGRQVLKVKWSAAGAAGPGERHFELRIPSCPVGALTLEVQAGRVPTVASPDVLLTGPYAVPADPKRQTWRMRFGDRARLEFGIRAAGEATPAGAVQAALVGRYDLSAGQAACSFEYDLKPARGAVGEWAFAVDPGLQIIDAKVTNRAGWRIDPATRELRVSLRQPGPGGKIEITAVAPLVRGPAVALPIIRPVGALVGEEQVEVRVHPDVRLAAWSPGDYRLTDSAIGPDQVRVLSLVGTLLPAGVDLPFRRPPQLGVGESDPEFTTAEGIEWRAERGRTRLTARVVLHVRRGPLFHVAFQAPPGFALGRATASPDDLVVPGDPAARGASPTVEFTRPLLAGQSAEVLLDFAGLPLPAGPVRLPFPYVIPVGASERDGWVRISPGAGWSAVGHPVPAATEATEFDFPEPPLPEAPAESVTYLFRGKEPAGELRLKPIRPSFTAEVDTRLEPAGNRLTAATTIALRIEAGELPGVTVFEPGPARTGRTWKVADGSNAVAAVVPVSPDRLPAVVPLLSVPWGEPAAALVTRAALANEPGTYWVIRFARPVTERVVLETASPVANTATPGDARAIASEYAAGRRPVLVVRGAKPSTTRIHLAAALGGEQPAPAPGTALGGWSFSDLHAITVVPSDGPAVVVFGGTVTGTGGPVLALRLPTGAEVRAAGAAGHWLDPGKCGIDPGTSELRLPVPPGESVRFEVRYRLPVESTWPVRSADSPVPELPDGPHEVRRWWVFPPGTLPAWPFTVRDRRTPADLPALLGERLDRPGGIVIGGFAGERVGVVPARLADAAGVGLAALLAALGWVGAWRANRSIGFALLVTLLGTGGAGSGRGGRTGRSASPCWSLSSAPAAPCCSARPPGSGPRNPRWSPAWSPREW
jgi:hypothetical protein